jgi:hypothetical protein
MCWPIDPTPNLEDRSVCLWVLSFDLSGTSGPTSSYATAGIAFRIIAPRKPPYPAKDAFVKVEIPQGQEIKGFSLHRQGRLGRMCPVGRTKRDAASEPSDSYSDGACVQSETFATLRLDKVKRAHLVSCRAFRVLVWLLGCLLSELGKYWNCRQILLKCSCQRVRWFWSCYRQTDVDRLDRLVGTLLQPFAFKASANISRRFCTNCLKLVWHCCPPRSMLELSTARHVFIEVMAPEHVQWIFRTLIGTDKKGRGTHPSRLTGSGSIKIWWRNTAKALLYW